MEVIEVVKSNRRLTIREIAAAIGIFFFFRHTNLKHDLGIGRVLEKFLLRIPTAQSRKNIVFL